MNRREGEEEEEVPVPHASPSEAHSDRAQEIADSVTTSCADMQSSNPTGDPHNLRKTDAPTQDSVRPDSPTPSCVSMKSDNSMLYPPHFREDVPTEQTVRPDSPTPSCVSMKSDNSMLYPPHFREDVPTEQTEECERPDSPTPSCVSMKSDNSMLYPPHFREDVPTEQTMESSDNSREEDITTQHRGQDEQKTVIAQFKHNMKKSVQCVFEGGTQENSPSCLTEIYTELYCTEGKQTGVNEEHEVRQIERSFGRTQDSAAQEKPMNCNDIFKPLPGQQKDIRTVLTNGIAGIGKTVTVQKFILDWTEGKANEDIQLMILLPFRELSLLKRTLLSLTELLQHFVKDIKDTMLSTFKVMLILDGLDESRIPLDFKSNEMCFDAAQPTSVDVLLTNLIKGNLLPSALLWITTRPAAANQIPPEFVDRLTEIRGFNDSQKDEYFRKKISDENLASRTITHLKSSRSLYIMCHIPVFCWIAATVLETLFSESKDGKIPRTLTQLYIHFLNTQKNVKKEKYSEREETYEGVILKLGKLAFQQLEEGNLIFYEEDLRECGIGMKEAAVYSGVCTQVFREESGLCKRKVFCFVHLTVQEYLAALYAHVSFSQHNMSVFEPAQPSALKKRSNRSKRSHLSSLHKEAIDRAVQSPNGHLDLFLRFLMGCSMRTNQNLLRSLLPSLRRSTERRHYTVKYLKQKIKENPSPEKCINLLHCLNELSYQPLVEEVQHFLCSKILPKIKLSSGQWMALVFILLTSDNDLDVFDLSKYMGSNEALQRLLSVVQVAKRVLIRKCNLAERSCEVLASVLRPPLSALRELDLSGSLLQLPQLKPLCAALASEDCKLEKLKLTGCHLSEESCAAVVSAFSSNPASLRELDMSDNLLGDSVVKKLSEALKVQQCRLQVLRLRGSGLEQEGFSDLALALRANPSHLRELDLSMNAAGDVAARTLCEVLIQPQCSLHGLKLNKCELTHDCCGSVASLLACESSSLVELHLSDNKLQDAGVEVLAAGLQASHCKLQVLKLCNCSVSVTGCGFVAGALRLNPAHLRELHLSWNHPADPRPNPLSELLATPPPGLRLEKLHVSPPVSVERP